MRTSFYLFHVLLALATALSAQSNPANTKPLSAAENSRQSLAALLPNPLPDRAVPQAAATFYTPEDLYKYMDGGADAFLLYDFQMLLHQDLRIKDTDLSVDVFDMGTAENAFGMYASERSPNYHYILIGAEGYDNEGILNFLQGSYYVKLAAFGSDAGPVLDQFAKLISQRIKTEAGFPAPLKLLPATNRLPHTEQFLLKDPLGHPFLSPAYLARYKLEGAEPTILLSMGTDPADAQGRLKLLAVHFTRTGQCQPAPELGDGAIRAGNSFEGKIIARAKGRYVLVMINPASSSEALFKDAIQHLD